MIWENTYVFHFPEIKKIWFNKNMSDDTEDSRHTPGENNQKFSYHI